MRAKAGVRIRGTAKVENIVEEEAPEKTEKLTDRQQSAICCLIEGNTLQASADTCGINVRTLRRWMQLPEFREEYNKARRQHLDHVAARLQSSADDAAETLARLLKCGDPLIELRAAKAILQISQKSVEAAELEKRAADLERSTAQQAKQIRHLKAENELLSSSYNELHDLKQGLEFGTLHRPEWVSKSAWERMFRLEEHRTRSA